MPEISRQSHNGPLLSRVNVFDIIDCQACGAVPLPGQCLAETYRETYSSAEKGAVSAGAGQDDAGRQTGLIAARP